MVQRARWWGRKEGRKDAGGAGGSSTLYRACEKYSSNLDIRKRSSEPLVPHGVSTSTADSRAILAYPLGALLLDISQLAPQIKGFTTERIIPFYTVQYRTVELHMYCTVQ